MKNTNKIQVEIANTLFFRFFNLMYLFKYSTIAIASITLLFSNTTSHAGTLDYIVDNHYDISIASFNNGTVLNVSAQENVPFSMLFSKDGSKFYVTGLEEGRLIHQYDLSLAFDLSTAVFNEVPALSEPRLTGNITKIFYNDDGSILYMLDRADVLWQYELLTSYDIATSRPVPFFPIAFSFGNFLTTSMIFNDDGSKLYVLNGNIKQYNLEFPYRIRSASFDRILFGIAEAALEMVFNNDGSKLYVLVVNGGIRQYDLGTAYDISSAVFSHIAHELSASGPHVSTMIFNNDGSKLYAMETVEGNVHQYDMNFTHYPETPANAGEIDNSSPLIVNLVDDTFSTTSGLLPAEQYTVDNVPVGLTPEFNIDSSGTQGTLTLTGTATAHDNINDVNDLSFTFTNAAFTSGDASSVVNSGFDSAYSTYASIDFLDDASLDYILIDSDDLSAAKFNRSVLDLLSYDQAPITMIFNNDGSKFYVLGLRNPDHSDGSNRVLQFNLHRAYDISTATYAGVALNLREDPTQITESNLSIMFNNDGSKLYALESFSETIYQYNLDIAYDISTSSSSSLALDVSDQESKPRSMLFNNDGNRLYVMGWNGLDINQYDLSIAYDISTASFASIVLDIAVQGILPVAMIFSKDGSKLYILEDRHDDINQYDLDIAYDISTASFSRVAMRVVAEESDPIAMIFNHAGSKLYTMGFDDVIDQYDLSATLYREASANDGLIDNSFPLVINLKNDTFTSSSAALPVDQYTIDNIPAGLSPILNIDVTATKATLIFTGAALNHQNLDDIAADLSFSFTDAAFTSGDASNIINSGSASPFSFNVTFDFTDNISMTYTAGDYVETSLNIGELDNSNPLTISLADDITTGTFSTSSGVLPSDLYDIDRVPAGLLPILTIDSTGTLGTLTFSGSAVEHQSSNNVVGFPIRFYDQAFTGGDSEIIVNSGFRMGSKYMAEATIDFDENPRLKYVVNASYDILHAQEVSLSLDPPDSLDSIIFNNDGSKLFLLNHFGVDNGSHIDINITEYSLSMAYNISTASFNGNALDMDESDGRNYHSMMFNNDGFTLYLLGSGSDEIYQYNLDTAYDISSASGNSVALMVGAQETAPKSMIFNNDGSKLYVMGSSDDDINQYNLSTMYDISTASFAGVALDVSAQEVAPYSMIFNDDGTVLYVMGKAGDDINQYDLSSAYEISTASFNTVVLSVDDLGLTGQLSMLYNQDGSSLYVMGGSIYKYKLTFNNFPEASLNDGSIDNTHPLVIQLSDDTFTTTSGTMPSNQYTVGNLPAGLTSVLSIDSTGTEATLTFSGNATAHQNSNDITDLTMTFTDAVFTDGNAAVVFNSGAVTAYSTNIGIDFADNIGFPIAVDDNYFINANSSVVLNPLDADSDPDGDILVLESINGINLIGGAQTIVVTNGIVSIDGSNVITYNPDVNFIGNVSFPYVISDGNGGNASANQIIEVTVMASIGGVVSGLSGFVSLQNNGEDDLTLKSNGSYQFSTLLGNGETFFVAISTQPTQPNQTCTAVNFSGTVAYTDITNIDINCITNNYFIGGSVNGLLDDNFMTIQNNLGNDLVLFNNGSFVFTQPLEDQSDYDVSIKTQPLNPIQPCLVVNGNSTLAGVDVIDIEITCELGDDLVFRNSFEQPVPQ